MSAHTPEPWGLQECSNGGMLIVRHNPDLREDQAYLQVFPEADARLMAAAPRLLKVCKAILECEKIKGPLAYILKDVIAQAEGK